MVENKILGLYDQRKVLDFAVTALGPTDFNHWYRLASSIQMRIYDLDEYYESHTEVGTIPEIELWERLEHSGGLLTGDAKGVLERAVCTLSEYACDEARLREPLPFEPAELRSVLRRKSADVHLARELVYVLQDHSHPSSPLRRFFRVFDEIMEVVEDWDDLSEDLEDWNLNFWLTPVRQGIEFNKAVAMTRALLLDACVEAEEAWLVLSVSERICYRTYWNQILNSAKLLDHQVEAQSKVLESLPFAPYCELKLEY